MNRKSLSRTLLLIGACVAGGTSWYLFASDGESSWLPPAGSEGKNAFTITQEHEMPSQFPPESSAVAEQNSVREGSNDVISGQARETGAEAFQAQVTQADAPASVDPPTLRVQSSVVSDRSRPSVVGSFSTQATTIVHARPAPASLPVIFNDAALKAVSLAPEQVAQVQQLRQDFIDQIGPQNVYDAAYLVRWQQAHANSNDALRARFGWTIFSALLAQSVAAGN